MVYTKKINFICVGRLVKEKWFDLILEMIKKVKQDTELQQYIHIDIFGDGELREKLEAGLSNWEFVTYHGHQPKEIVMQTRKDCHYTLIPSKFLETFGLTALDSLTLGIPILAPKKGWLAQFLQNKEQRTKREENIIGDLYSVVKEIVESFDQTQWENISQETKDITKKYSKERWLERFQQLSGLAPGAKVMLISDYIVDVGGIEHYLINVQALLEEGGYSVKLVGCADEHKAKNRFQQLFGTMRNTQAKKLIEQTVHDFQPDLLWWHSVQRWLGPAPLRSQHHFKGKQRVMYHDFWLFHPYPSAVEEEEQVKKTAHVIWYLWQWWKANKRAFVLYIAKWYSSAILKWLLANQIDFHLVPSAYMEDIIQAHYEQEISLATLAHFI